MPSVNCPIEGCTFVATNDDASIIAALLNIHCNTHAASGNSSLQKPPKVERPVIELRSSEESWNAFSVRWDMFKKSTQMSADETVRQLFQCCATELGNALLKSHRAVVSGNDEKALRDAIKKLAVPPVAICARRSALLTTKQDHSENARSYLARLNGKAATCNYVVTRTCSCEEEVEVDFTDIIVKDVLITGLVDEEIKKEILGWQELDNKTSEETVCIIEGKEMARDALASPSMTTAAISSYKKPEKQQTVMKTQCKSCSADMDSLVWSRRKGRMVECSLCPSCWRKRGKPKPNKNQETSGIIVGAVEVNEIATLHSDGIRSPILLDNYIFNSLDGWKKAEATSHPTLTLDLSTDKSDYVHVGASCPRIKSPCSVKVVGDTGAQSCLWSLDEFLKCGFKHSDLLPVKQTMRAANAEPISIEGAIFIRLSGRDASGNTLVAPVMTYVSSSTNKFYLSRDALIQLGIIPVNFPQIGSVSEISSIDHKLNSCGCPVRTLPPKRPDTLPFRCCPENNEQMKEWLLQYYAASTFNKCPHQQLQGMTGPEIELHIDPNATPVSVNVPTMVPLHWQEQVEKDLYADCDLDVLESVPHGEPSQWTHRMVLVRKPNGKARRAIDFSPLNKWCSRETHHVKPPFQQAKAIPPHTWKSMTDAWNGYHSVPIRKQDRHLTTFITPWGRFRYKKAPQGLLASGDGYTRRFDEIISDVERKTKCVDDTVLWDESLEAHWWRMIDFLELLGTNGIVLNPEKFQFAQREIDFAGFHITDTELRPHEKFLESIAEFPIPSKVTDIRSWFGLVHQVAHYAKLTDLMAPFKPLLSPKVKFEWTPEMDTAFQKSKQEIVAAIKSGVEIFDPKRRTCLQPDWSKTGMGFFLSQKHCGCSSLSPGCCQNGWRVALAGSRFLKPAETRYASIEGEALAIAWSLEQTRFFTLVCDNLLIVTDHKPLVKLLGDRALDAITNPRLFRLKERTLLWRFDIEHTPGKTHYFADAMSRNPVGESGHETDFEISCCEIFEGLRNASIWSYPSCVAAHESATDPIKAVTWNRVKVETQKDVHMMNLQEMIQSVFPLTRNEMPASIVDYWDIKDRLYVVDGVVMRDDNVVPKPALDDGPDEFSVFDAGNRVIIPPSLRREVLDTLHAAHQGVSAMHERAKSSVYWPGITNDIQSLRDTCESCNRNAPSQIRPPPVAPWIPSTPFEAVVCDYFDFQGWHYFVYADRLSGWTEAERVRVGTHEAGSHGLCDALRRLFSRFGVPVEVASDGGPEFAARQTTDFLERWGVHHRLSSVSFAQSNGRAELAVKTTKRLLLDNVGPDGSLDTDKVARALLTLRNTPVAGGKLSPAQILFGRTLKDTLPFIQPKFRDTNLLLPQWKEAWKLKEEAMKARYVKTMESLSKPCKPLPQLQVGDRVFIQNQSGRFPKKWDRSGIVMEIKPNDQFVVKVLGTGRLTMRNRRFLRKYTVHPHPDFQGKQAVFEPIRPLQIASQHKKSVSDTAADGDRIESASELPEVLDPVSNPSDFAPTLTDDLQGNTVQLDSEVAKKPDSSRMGMVTQLASFNKPGLRENVDILTGPTPSSSRDDMRRRSSRQRISTKQYDAASGTWKG